MFTVVAFACDAADPARVAALVDTLWSGLTPHEQDHGARLQRAADQLLFGLGRLALRTALARHNFANPGTVITTGKRPRLAGPLEHRLSFSIAHTAGLAVCALAPRGLLGIDVERADRSNAASAIETQACSDAERRALPTDPALRNLALLQLWTRKEAAAKALGVGLAADPKTILSLLDPACRLLTLQHEAHIVSIATDCAEPPVWENYAAPAPTAPSTRFAIADTDPAWMSCITRIV